MVADLVKLPVRATWPGISEVMIDARRSSVTTLPGQRAAENLPHVHLDEVAQVRVAPHLGEAVQQRLVGGRSQVDDPPAVDRPVFLRLHPVFDVEQWLLAACSYRLAVRGAILRGAHEIHP